MALPEPNWIKGTDEVPFVLMPLNITVMRFTPEGIPVKSILVPDVLATEVPLTNCDPVPGTVSHGYQVVFDSRYTYEAAVCAGKNVTAPEMLWPVLP